MTDLTREAATSLLSDAVAIWRLQPGLVEDVVDAAVDCLVADVDTPSLRVLAGADPKDSRWVLEPLIEDTVRELGLTELLSISPQRAALTVMLRRLEANEVSASELVGWAHTHVGHDGDADCQRFVDLYDAYGVADYTGQSLSELDQWTREEADAFLAGRPSPRRWSTRTWDEPRAVIVGPRRWRRRFTVRVLPGGREFSAARWADVWASLPGLGVPLRNLSFETANVRRQVIALWGDDPDSPVE